MARWIRPSLVALLTGLFLTGCGNGNDAADSVEGTWLSDDGSGAELTLDREGKVTGTDGCNRLMGSWSTDDGAITFHQVASTMMYCEGVDTWLSGLATADVEDDTMTVYDRQGSPIGTLTR